MTHVFETVADNPAPMRLDKYIAAKSSLPGAPPSRSALKAHGGAAYVNGAPAKFSMQVRLSDSIRIEWTEEDVASLMAEDIPLDIIYEDDNVTVVNKAQGMVTHPAAGHWSGTLVNALLGRSLAASQAAMIPSCGFADPSAAFRPGIVHRLDKDTSGVIITAKSPEALVYLQSQFKSHAVRKEYIAIVKGRPPAASGVIGCNIARSRHDRKKFAAKNDPSRGRNAKTLYHCLASYGQYSIMRVRLKTGRTHQVRVHLKHIGCPILGDSIYSSRDSLFPDASLMLHSRLLEICLPGETRRRLFIAPVPERFCNVLSTLKQKYPKQSRLNSPD